MRSDDWLVFDDEALPWLVWVQVPRTKIDDEYKATSFRLEARDPLDRRAAVTPTALRQLKLGEIKRAAERLRHNATASPTPRKRRNPKEVADPPAGQFFDVAQLFRPPADVVPRAAVDEETHLRTVAEIYLNAGSANPTHAVQLHWGVSRSTASKWVHAAREREFLGWPKKRGVAGTSERKSPSKGKKK